MEVAVLAATLFLLCGGGMYDTHSYLCNKYVSIIFLEIIEAQVVQFNSFKNYTDMILKITV